MAIASRKAAFQVSPRVIWDDHNIYETIAYDIILININHCWQILSLHFCRRDSSHRLLAGKIWTSHGEWEWECPLHQLRQQRSNQTSFAGDPPRKPLTIEIPTPTTPYWTLKTLTTFLVVLLVLFSPASSPVALNFQDHFHRLVSSTRRFSDGQIESVRCRGGVDETCRSLGFRWTEGSRGGMSFIVIFLGGKMKRWWDQGQDQRQALPRCWVPKISALSGRRSASTVTMMSLSLLPSSGEISPPP